MRQKNDYTPESVTDLEKYIPDYVKSRIAEGISSNLLNRFLTKPDFAEFNGYVGQFDPGSELNKIPEENDFRNKNQLQPIINHTIATQNYHLSFEDFIRRLTRQGVDTEAFNMWGRSQQFNWVPPIDIDKIINFRNYYWIGGGIPEYITIKNPVTAQQAYFEELKLSLFNKSQNHIVVDSFSQIAQSTNSRFILMYEFNRNRATIAETSAGNVIEVEASSDFSQPPSVNEFIELDIPIIEVTSSKSFLVSGNYADSGLLNTVVSVIEGNVETLVKVLEIEYDEVTELSTFIIEQNINSNSSVLSFHPVIFAEMHHYEYLNNLIIPDYSGVSSFYDIGKGLYYDRVLTDVGIDGETQIGDTFLSDNTKNFGNLLNTSKRYELRILEGNNSGTYPIVNFIGNILEVEIPSRFFPQNNIPYEIYEKVDIASLSQIQTSGIIIYDTQTDSILINGVPVTNNASLLIDIIDTNEFIENEWTNSNKWVHVNQVESFSDTVQARLPIIEYDNDIPLSQTSSVEYEWRYSSSPENSYVKVDSSPSLLELQPIKAVDIVYESPTTFIVPEKYGVLDLLLEKGQNIRFSGFSVNDGVYQISDVEFEVLGSGNRAISRITINTPLPSLTDNASNGVITLINTSRGEVFNPNYDHWEFAGVKNITPSSVEGEINPLLNEYISGGYSTSTEGEEYIYLLGEVWQEFSPQSSTYNGPTFNLDPILHDLCLFQDYQEGDIRVYVDGIRQYGNFQEVSDNLGKFITSIKFDNDVTITPNNRVRIELGEYFKKDIGKRNVLLKFNSETTPFDNYNLVDERKVEQEKISSNQYPLFKLFDILGNAVPVANQIFKYKENPNNPVVRDILKRLEIGPENDFVFEQLLFKDNSQKMLAYKSVNSDAIKSIWRRGTNNEIQIPRKNPDGTWDMPNSWYFNITHKNEKSISLRQLFRHFSTIIDSQNNPYLSGTANNFYHGIKSPNVAVGGTIKEHNDSLDLLASFTLLNNANPIEIVRFAGSMYDQQLQEAVDHFYLNILDGLDASETFLVDFIENNKKFDQWFGDSTSLQGEAGLKGMVASSAVIGATPPSTPLIIDYNNQIYIRHHDGHVSCCSIVGKAKKLNTFKLISKDVIRVSDISMLPDANDFDEGDFLTQIVTLNKSINLYKNILNEWEPIDVDRIVANMVLQIEKRLFEVASATTKTYDFNDLDQIKYKNLLKESFSSFYLKRGVIEPLQNSDYDPSDPFTWNYSHSVMNVDPLDGQQSQPGYGSWQALYESLFNTAFPHKEPWKMQGYGSKPQWWDQEYLNTDITVLRYWRLEMWENILLGKVPEGQALPFGGVSSGLNGELRGYLYIPVNFDLDTTLDGIKTEELIPPFWNSANSSNPSIRSPFNKNDGDIIVNAESAFVFGQNGYKEWQWRNSISFNYDRLVAAYKLDPMRVVHRFFGNEYVNVDCLQVDKESERVYSHSISKFHGDIINENEVFKINGLFQWFTHYNRYYGFDGSSSEFRDLWKNWNINLGYLFGNVINSDTFEISSQSIDIAPPDFDIRFKQIEGMFNFQFKAISSTINKMPSILSANREASADWIFNLNFSSPDDNSIKLYKPENFPFRKTTSTDLQIYSFPVLKAGLDGPRGFTRFSYQNPLTLSDNTFYFGTVGFQISIDGGSAITFSVDAEDAPTVGHAISAINEKAVGFSLRLDAGDLIVESELEDASSSVEIVQDLNFFSGLTSGPPLMPNGQQGQTPIIFLGYFDVSIDSSKYLNSGDGFSIVDSTELDGEYTIRRVLINPNSNTIRLFVNERPLLFSGTVDGNVIPNNSRTLPWETGQEVYFNTTGILPGNMLDYIPYYIIKVDDYTFQIAETPESAEKGVAIEFSSDGNGFHNVGRVRATFKPLNGVVDYPWRRHFADKREIYELRGPVSISTIQSLCDVIFGYEEYLEDVGIVTDNERLDNSDENSGRARDWQLEIEKFIDWAFSFRSLKNTETVEVEGVINTVNNTIDIKGDIPWGIGAEVAIRSVSGAPLPQDVALMNSFLPFYVIRNSNNRSIQLASTFNDAVNGIPINLMDSGGKILILNFKNVRSKPTKILNPFTRQLSLTHEQGLPANLIQGNNLDVLTTQKIYGTTLTDLTEKELKFFRRDRFSVVRLLDSVNDNISGANIFIDGIEHVIIFNNYSTDNRLIYDSFLGINTPRFFLNFVKPLTTTKRPSISGLVIQGDVMTSSIEKAINDIRFYYDPYMSFENEDSTIEARNSVGYEGRKGYMDALGISPRSQFIYWQGYIQSKGTQKSLDAFSQHRKLQGISVDEFWAYRLCRFGDDKQYIYPEMVLTTDDVSKTELRLEFTPPTGGTLGKNYTQIRLTDRDRWLNQPDILEYFREAYYFEPKIIKIINDAENLVFDSTLVSGDKKYLKIDSPILNVMISYDDENGDRKIALENRDYEIRNLQLLEFVNLDFPNWTNISVAGISYNYDAEHPAKIIDKSSPAKVIADVPIWNPAFGEHNPIGRYPIDIDSNIDPAKYNDSLITNHLDFWSSGEVGKVWFDNTLAHYVPYYDNKVFPSVDDRSLNWGKLEEFGDIKLYQWIETSIPPEEYDSLSEKDEQEQSKPIADRITGNTRKVLYRSIPSGWYEERTIVIKINIVDVGSSAIFTILDPLVNYASDIGEVEIPLEIYKNGKKTNTINSISISGLIAYLETAFNNGDFTEADYITIVKPIAIPTDEELENEDFVYYTPRTVVTRFNNVKQEEEKLYYYWVENLKNEKLLNDTSLTLFDAKREMLKMNRPYMFIEGFRFEGVGYGILFGDTFDPDENSLPTRFTQCIVKGLKNTVKDNNRYVLRFVKNFTLRDHLNEKDLSLKNVHWEWKLFRKNQAAKIDSILWEKVIESVCGFSLIDGNLDFDSPLPTFEREIYDRFQNGNTRIGIRRGQVILDKEPLIQLLLSILLDPKREYLTVNIGEFVNSFNINDPIEASRMLETIYNAFTEKEVNDIFFEILKESLIARKEHPDFLKTSWVSIDVAARTNVKPQNTINIPETHPSTFCFLSLKEVEAEIDGSSAGVNSSYTNSAYVGAS